MDSKDHIPRDLLHYETVGKEGAPWLVFVHGAGGSIRTWKFQLEYFSKNFRLLLLDLRDHGFSKNIQPEYKAYDFDIVACDIIKVIDHLIPNVTGMGLRDALYILENHGLRVRFKGHGKVRSQSPTYGTPFEKGTIITLELN